MRIVAKGRTLSQVRQESLRDRPGDLQLSIRRNGAEWQTHCVAVARQMEKGRTAQDRAAELPYFTVAQMAAVVNAAKTQLNRALFALAAGTGARAGELFALRVEADVNLSEETITIRRSVFEGEENTSKSDTGDEDRTRTVPLIRP